MCEFLFKVLCDFLFKDASFTRFCIDIELMANSTYTSYLSEADLTQVIFL